MTTLANFDFTVLIDFSGSMATVDAGKKVSRIQGVKESLTGLVSELAAVDEDGIDVITFGGELIQHTPGVKDSSIIETIFSGRRVAGGTPTAEALTKAFEVAGKSDKPDFLVVFTDGDLDREGFTAAVARAVEHIRDHEIEKVVLARELSRELRLLVASQPTRGLDVGSIEFVHEQIVATRDKGIPVMIVATELDEATALGDRIAVMYRGKIVGIVDSNASREKLGKMMAGITA